MQKDNKEEHLHNHKHNDNCEHTHEHGHNNINNILKRVAIALIFFAAAFYYKPLFIAAYLIAGWDVLICALKNIAKLRPNNLFDENFLMAIATIGAFLIGEYPEAVMVMVLYQIGDFFQHRAVEKSRKSIADLMDIRPDYANLNGKKVDPKTVQKGDIITVKTGEKIPLDGIVVQGSASIDTSSLNGEFVLKTVQKEDEVLSGCINKDGVLKIKVTKEFSESTVSKILKLVREASDKKAKTENFITKFAKYYTPCVVVLAVLIAFVPLFLGYRDGINRALVFLVISCPCALVISIPLSFFAGIGAASRRGVLIKGSNYIETLSKTGTVVFDKTGTLTRGKFKVQKIVSKKECLSENELLKYAACAEYASNHPIARALAEEYGKEISTQYEIKETPGLGVSAQIEGKTVLIGSAKFVSAEPVDENGTIVYISIDNIFCGYIVISDSIKEESKNTIDFLRKMNIKSVILTGDTKKNADIVQKTLKTDKIHAELMPDDKVRIIDEIICASKGDKTVIFTGDGINDAPVLARADVGISMGALGSDAAVEASDIVIMDDNPIKIIDAIKISKKTIKIVKQNIFFALFIKILFLVLGTFGFMTMWGAVFSDVGVTLIAIINALRILK